MTERKIGSATKVEICGREYQITGESEEYLQELARYVDSQLANLSQTQTVYSPGRLGILACLNIADELYKLKEKHKLASTKLLNTVNNLIEKVDLVLEKNDSRSEKDREEAELVLAKN